MADIQSPTDEIRGGEKTEERRNDRMKIYMVYLVT